ncbi:putative heme-binding domain-containing protein [Rhodopirellula rubra]|uniref:Putative heme-binding domain-containing protein n=1 Tax=Aporhodopirellula rubra TaxID=980271 RepID=A0A7W5DZR4_9BACT|nr:family 16 glycoside hydrolase [Aporhodopirellula rubra]MBB3207450.1 putative heme-binding domain-containing protein [Aporhodopirellula rubra]
MLKMRPAPAIFVGLCLLLFAGGAHADDATTKANPPETDQTARQFEILFDGKTLDGWKGLDEFWSVVNGAIQGQTTADRPTNGNTFLIWQGGDVGDFEFRCKVRFEGNNSGVQYRSKLVDADTFALAGYQADLHPKQEYFGMMYGERTGRGIIATRGQRVIVGTDGKSKVIGKVGNDTELIGEEWNDLRIVAVGNRMIHQVNGITTLDLTDHHKDATTSGKLGLQLHAGPPMKVEFRGLLMRPLSGRDAESTLSEVLHQPAPATVSAGTSGSNTDQAEAPNTYKGSEWLLANPNPTWIWANESKPKQKVWLRHTFDVAGDVDAAWLYSTCDNSLKLSINGKPVGSSNEWAKPLQKNVTKYLQTGRNVVTAECGNQEGIAAFVFKMSIELKNGKQATIVSNGDWRLSEKQIADWQNASFDDSNWQSAIASKELGADPWNVPGRGGNAGSRSGDPLHAKNVMVPPGFEIDRVYSIPNDQGSWVSMAIDPQGRIYASDQGGQGLYRVTLKTTGPPIVEKVSTGALSDFSGAQGLVWAQDSLWFHRSGGNLYRLTDSDGDDRLDTAESYPGGTGGGEHGNHAVIVTEDGNALYLDGGNHAPMGDIAASRVPTWYEGLLLPRMWDSNGHARGLLAPGGWVTRVDPESKTQTLHSIGYRNQYDITLNRFGDLFTYDADMEWDMGTPWYRPTRICNVVSGSDFGWRSGSGKWPAYYEDSLPPVVDIGPGSPTGMISGAGTRFPTRYQDALFGLDWTFGTIYAIHLTPEGASYRGEAEPFAYGTPLPVTDAVVGLDGALYFAVGGRGTESALFRIRYVGNESTEAPTHVNPENVAARELRRSLESFHGVKAPTAIDQAWPHLASPDRFIRHAARIAVESQDVADWADRALSETQPQRAITSAVALARRGDASHAAPLIENLLRLRAEELSEGELLGLLRAYALIFMQLEKPSETQTQHVLAQLDPLMPSTLPNVNIELIRLFTFLQSPTVARNAIDLIRNRTAPEMPDWGTLASRNSSYGSAVNRMLENPPPSQEIMIAFMLRTLRNGWSLDLRREYFQFLNEAAKTSGGSSFPGYLTRIRDEALTGCSNEERTALNEITGENFDPAPDFEIAPIEGPGRKWDIASVLAAASQGKPDFERGRSLYFSGKCASCHRIAGLGGNIGPDLTSIPSKFDQKYVVEAIIDPSKVISDQYGSSTVLLADGSLLTGLVIKRDQGNLTVYPNLADAEPIEVDADDVEEVVPSSVSQMPLELLDGMNDGEVRDLLGYLMSGGNPSDRRYRK